MKESYEAKEVKEEIKFNSDQQSVPVKITTTEVGKDECKDSSPKDVLQMINMDESSIKLEDEQKIEKKTSSADEKSEKKEEVLAIDNEKGMVDMMTFETCKVSDSKKELENEKKEVLTENSEMQNKVASEGIHEIGKESTEQSKGKKDEYNIEEGKKVADSVDEVEHDKNNDIKCEVHQTEKEGKEQHDEVSNSSSKTEGASEKHTLDELEKEHSDKDLEKEKQSESNKEIQIENSKQLDEWKTGVSIPADVTISNKTVENQEESEENVQKEGTEAGKLVGDSIGVNDSVLKTDIESSCSKVEFLGSDKSKLTEKAITSN